MKLQDLHPYDSFIVGINNIYFIDYQGDFHINAPFIIAANKTISTGNTYILINSRNNTNCTTQPVKLLDAYYDDGVIFLIVRDITSQKGFTIDQKIECTGDHYKWLIIDLDFMVEELNTEIIKSYCGTCAETKKKSVVDSNNRRPNDDLLEFDF